MIEIVCYEYDLSSCKARIASLPKWTRGIKGVRHDRFAPCSGAKIDISPQEKYR